MKMLFLVLLFIVGAVFGSFVTCQAWRIRYKELGKKKLGKRSVCLKCGYKLKWYDNIPIISWLMLGGKCRKCHKKIGTAEILSELLMALAFLGIGTTIEPTTATLQEWGILVSTLLLIISLGFLAVYDGKWGELPNFALFISAILAAIVAFLKFDGTAPWGILGAVFILGGVYLILYLVSKGKWVGNGDYILGALLGLALGDAWLALIALFLANLSGCLIMLPTIKKKKQKKIYFGPFLIAGFVIVVIFADFLKGII